MKPDCDRVVVEGYPTSLFQVFNDKGLLQALQQAGFRQPRPTLVVVGGASKLGSHDMERIRTLFTDVLAPLAEELGLYVVDGGTAAGVMQLMGEARAASGYTFPLIGVAPVGLVDLPTLPASLPDAAPLEANHSHCFLVPGQTWGDESIWIARTATELAGPYPSVVVLVNGGEITWQDATNNVHADRPIIVIEGSGRTADIIAAAIQGHTVAEKRADALVKSGLVQSVALNDDIAVLQHRLQSILLQPAQAE